MSYYRWDDSLLISVPLCDEHHQHLFALFNKTHDQMQGNASADYINSVFNELIEYASYHFSAEERLMRQNNFPGLEEHLKEHAAFSQRVTEMHAAHLQGREHLSTDLLSFLTNWITLHIKNLDARFGRFMACRR